ncbi:acyl-CoA thioesterase [Chitinophaga pendula]|uniref:acyl-CoA thioesterase n=1 Tax=Chitinophaga TaxID=79328 RepID=UPI000BAEEFDC|nr:MULTISPECIES: acyl-CoA thioesterase [Chitinophaga]ASZ11460.1 4-hydroxybenzoyl-CoA thioesterase [Chitinophaga sp. MD30]UCJ05530.1 acyl-CoA thioesterase [Chitinophaga pendula]
MEQVLTERTTIRVRFNEADPLGIVWHGHYVRYFEDGREAFGEKYGLRYLDIFEQGYTVPVVNIQCNYKRSLRYGDTVVVETTYISTAAAKIKFEYRLFNEATGELIADGSSIQVFLDAASSTLQLTIPAFFAAWKEKHQVGAGH